MVSTCLLTFSSGVAVRVEKGQVEGENGDFFEWDFCEGIDSPGSDCDGALICQTTSQGVEEGCGSVPHFNQTIQNPCSLLLFPLFETKKGFNFQKNSDHDFDWRKEL